MVTETKTTAKARLGAPADRESAVGLPPYISSAWQSAFAVPAVITAHCFRFAGRRMQANAEYLERLAKCHTVTDLVETQSLYAEETVSDYQGGIEEMARDVQQAIPSAVAA